MSFYNYISSPEGKTVIASGWKKLGIFDAVEMGLSKLDLFNDICQLMEIILPKETSSLTSLFSHEFKLCRTKVADDTDEDESKWQFDDANKILIRMMNTTVMCATHLICFGMSKWKHFNIFYISSSLYS